MKLTFQCLSIRFNWDTYVFLHIIFGGISAPAAELSSLTDWPVLPNSYCLALIQSLQIPYKG